MASQSYPVTELLSGPRIEQLNVTTLSIPTDSTESDGTLQWSSTPVVVVEVRSGDTVGLGYSYSTPASAAVVMDTLCPVVQGQPVMSVSRSFWNMLDAVRDQGRAGIAASAISAVDIALWDLKARMLDLSLGDLLGAVRSSVPLYGSGGFTSYSETRLLEQLSGWVDEGFTAVKMKVGRHPTHDPGRVGAARKAIGDRIELFVDASGAYDRKRALGMAERFAEHHVTWFEEPVSSDDIEGLALVRDRAPAGMQISAGQYGFDMFHFRRLLQRDAVDVLQADATRCLGITGFLRAAALCEAWCIPMSCHTAPSLHVFLGCACPRVVHMEWFFDHVRIERMLFDGVLVPHGGVLEPDRSRPGLGITLERRAIERYAA